MSTRDGSMRVGRGFSFANVAASFTMLTAMMVLGVACGQPVAETAMPAAMLAPDTPVTVTGGQIRGALADTNPEIVSFKGVPYAAPPVGDLRWKPPQPVAAWGGLRDATAAGPICMQTGAQDGSQSEDCLLLNVWAPKETDAPLPVMVWIHGGGFFNGAGSPKMASCW